MGMPTAAWTRPKMTDRRALAARLRCSAPRRKTHSSPSTRSGRPRISSVTNRAGINVSSTPGVAPGRPTPTTGLPWPPSAVHQPKSRPGTWISGVATMSTANSTGMARRKCRSRRPVTRGHTSLREVSVWRAASARRKPTKARTATVSRSSGFTAWQGRAAPATGGRPPGWYRGGTTSAMDDRPRNLKAMLSEAKDTSELMVDLGYAALFFADLAMAEEVVELEERLTSLLHDMRAICVLAARSPRDADEMAGVLGIVSAIERMGSAAVDVARIVTHRLGIPNALVADLAAAEEVSHRVRVREDSAMAHRRLSDLELPTEVGMRVVALRRGKEWTIDPDG